MCIMVDYSFRKLLVQVVFPDSSSRYVFLPIKDCVPSKLKNYASSCGALLCLCPAKYGCRQFCADE